MIDDLSRLAVSLNPTISIKYFIIFAFASVEDVTDNKTTICI